MTAKIISLVNMKWWVWKTTFTANLWYSLSYYKDKKVLLIDLDPQFNLTQYYIPVNDYKKRFESWWKFLKDIFNYDWDSFSLIDWNIEEEKVKFNDLKIRLREFKSWWKLDLLPSDLDLANIPENMEYKLSNFLWDIKNDYDFILIDCPPTISKFTKLAFIASDYYIVPTKKEHFWIIWLDLLTRRIQDFEKLYKKKINYLWLVFIAVTTSKTINRTIDNMLTDSEKVFLHEIKKNDDYLKAWENNKSIMEYTRKTTLKNQLTNLTDEILEKFI